MAMIVNAPAVTCYAVGVKNAISDENRKNIIDINTTALPRFSIGDCEAVYSDILLDVETSDSIVAIYSGNIRFPIPLLQLSFGAIKATVDVDTFIYSYLGR